MARAWKIILSTFLPFHCTFQRLELEKRWWHRLSVVVFIAALPSAFLVTAGLCYLTFAPQVSSMPDIWQTVNSADAQSLKPGDPIPADAQVGASSDWVDVPQGTAAIPPTPDGSAIVEPEKSKTVPIPPGAQIDGNDPQWVNEPASDDKSVQMPDGTTATFPGGMSDEAIKAHWTRLKHHLTLRAILFAALIAILSTLIFSYALQVAYRALLYVIFGGKPSTASDSATA